MTTTITMTVVFVITSTIASAGANSIAMPLPIPRTSSPLCRSVHVSISDAAQAQFANAVGTPIRDA